MTSINKGDTGRAVLDILSRSGNTNWTSIHYSVSDCLVLSGRLGQGLPVVLAGCLLYKSVPHSDKAVAFSLLPLATYRLEKLGCYSL